jgi:glutamine cyclotransferase
MLRNIRYFIACLTVGCFSPVSVSLELPERIDLRHIASYPHDEKAFTQGLLWNGGVLYESTGQYGESTLRRVDPKTGTVTGYVNLPPRFFAEGLTLIGDSLFQLTWRENLCFVFDKATLQKKGQFQYSGEGWGLANDGNLLIVSDGTNVLRFFDPKTFKQKRKIEVTDKNVRTKRSEPVRNLNELEWVHGEIWANVWQTTKIVRIEPQKGNVIGWIELEKFVPAKHRRDTNECVLNGIAFDPATNQIYITGKYWDVIHLFQIELPK